MFHIQSISLIVWWNLKCTHQQVSADDGPDYNDTDTCSFISGQNCDGNGICRYCAMCLQSSCILSKVTPSNKTIGTPVCNKTQFGTADVYDWYGYCLSSGNDNSGDYCETRTQCYQYLRNRNTSTSYTWRNLTCDPDRCVLMTDNGQPAPLPGALPPTDDPSATSNHNNQTHGVTPHSIEEHNPTVIALSVTCTLIFVGVLLWFFRLWKQSSYWSPPCLKWIAPIASSTSSTSAMSFPNSAPPSFRSTAPDIASIVATGTTSRLQRPSPSSSIRSSSNGGEPLPSYFSPDPSPPKYEHAIVTQIRGLLEDNNPNYQPGTSSYTSTALDHATVLDHDYYDESMTMQYHDNALSPPMWVPIYFASNHTSFSLGRLRRHPQQHQSSNRNNISTREGRDSPFPSTSEHDLGSSSSFYSASTSVSQPRFYQHQQDQHSRQFGTS